MTIRFTILKNAYFQPMLFLKSKVLFCWLMLFTVLMQSCNLEGYDDEVLEEAEIEESEEKKTLSYWEIRDLAKGQRGAYEFINNVAWWGYESGYQWIDGEHYRDSSMLGVNIKKTVDQVFIDLSFDLESLQPFPIVYDYKFNDKDEADYLHVELIIRNNKNSKKIRLSDNVSLSTTGTGSFNAELELEDFKDLAAGNVVYTAELKTVLTSFFDIRSKVKPITAKFSINFEVPQMYKTVLAFKSLRLNETETRKLLGDNDFSNGTPEAGINILYNGSSVLYKFTKNSYSHLRSHKTTIYHLTPKAEVEIRTLDVDYGFNSDDIISDTTLNLGSLEGTDYINLKMKCVDELLIYTQYKGKAN